MRYLTTLLSVLIISISTLQAQEGLGKGETAFSAGFGLLSTFAADNARNLVPPVSLRAEYALSDNFTLGAFGGYSSSEGQPRQQLDGRREYFRTRLLMFGLRATAQAAPNGGPWQVYGGAQLGYSLPDVDRIILEQPEPQGDAPVVVPGPPPVRRGMMYGAFFGSNYQLTPTTAIYGELGLGISLLQLGARFSL